MNVDFHAHVYPEVYLDTLERVQERYDLRLRRDAQGHLRFYHQGFDFGPVTNTGTDPRQRLADMDKADIDMQVVTMGNPSIDMLEPEEGVPLMRAINDAIAEMVQKCPDRLVGFAAMYLKDIDACVKEMERASKELGLKGFSTFTNCDGVYLSDRSFRPFFEAAEVLDRPVFIHPLNAAPNPALKRFHMAATVGFIFETTVVATTLVYDGLLEAHPRLKLVFNHLGGAIPFLAERLERAHRFPEVQKSIPQKPSEYFKLLYWDTVSFYGPAVECAYAFAGVDKLLMGSDYPFGAGDLGRAVSSIQETSIPDEDKEKILAGTACKLLDLG
ncbi:amidohydrolase family protein [Acidobacteria bacterium AH-259-D05]|nr:amidohydrolase family protein [Acidobacteria bacterium AH-259-D05]